MASVPNYAAHWHIRADKGGSWLRRLQTRDKISRPQAYEHLSIRAADRERALAMAKIDRKGENPELGMSVWGLS